MTASERTKDMMTRLRPMAVRSGGIWQKGEGVWLDIGNYKARVILNGKELICDVNHFSDLDGYGTSEIAMEIMHKNIATLPKLKRKKSLVDEKPRRAVNNDVFYYNYNVVSRNGRPHAVPYPPPIDPPQQIIGHDVPPQEAGNNV